LYFKQPGLVLNM